MPVRFKGLSEYQRNFLWKKSYLSESYNPSVGCKSSWAGLRSDQLGITKEPSFISKRRVPCHDSQISKSLEWNGANTENDMAVPPEPQTLQTPKPQEAEQTEDANQERALLLEASRVPKRTRSHSVDSRAEGASDAVEKHQEVTRNHEEVELEPSTKPLKESVDPRLDRHLRKKAGLTVVPSHNALRNSEYQRQFVWKTCKETAPVFTANQVFRNKSQIVPYFKGNTVIHETEYKRNFKGLSPVKEPKLREDLKGNGDLETLSPEKADKPLELEVDMASEDSDQPKKKLAPWRHQKLGKVNSEYRAKFLSPAQYLYKAGAWTHMKENVPNQVKELREKAQSYRKRVQGTHFSRDHLNQILSDSNCCWDVSSTTSSEGAISSNIRALDLASDLISHKTPQKLTPTKLEEKKFALGEKNTTRELALPEEATIPVRRKLVWDEEGANEDTQEQPTGDRDEERGKVKQISVGEPEKLDTQVKSTADRVKEGSESSSISSGNGGRLPTPKLRELGIQRTHHDLTTPAVGGAVLVSPSKGKPSAPEQRKRESSQDGLDTLKKDLPKKGNHCAVSLLTSPAAGIKTVDPLPLREDCEANAHRFAEAILPVSKVPEHQISTLGQPSTPCVLPYWHPSSRIQGCLRDPEFQHNVRKPRMNNLLLPSHKAFNDEDADRLSEISARSAASSLRAFQTLVRAQKRKENFWGKT
ncbi:nuclear protein MDM1 isoform X2 [Cricetulus griseus]|uniref:Nuclear protein MDM1 n=1 Tax=Cricetulus griseus TaxID=10029 RepID=A0A9J7J786_CRIGR|nr:nuclear protein MDM1 isoform X2 [Cricetulus griseus]ERE92178.1 nuclear protein MDM1-like isoform 1 [Cricetulus griseus]